MEKSIWDKMQAVDRRWLYAVLIVLVSFGLFVSPDIPAEVDDSSAGLYVSLSELYETDPDKPILLQSDWTNSTRGENMGHLEALLRMIMSRDQKFVLYSFADPQAPQVARDTFLRLNRELPEDQRYKKGVDYIDLGFFPNAESATQSLANNLSLFWQGRKTKVEGESGVEKDIFKTPVLQGIERVEDCGMLIVVTPSNTIDIAVERLSGRIPIGCMCTGVVGPQILPYYNAGQVAGLAIGLKSVYDMEMMMARGLNHEGTENTVRNKKYSSSSAAPIEGQAYGRGKQYFAALNIALGLMVVAVIMGNIGMFASKRKRGEA